MRATLGVSARETRTMPPSLRLVLWAFEVRMWRILDWPRLNLPVPVFLKRLAAPECVFNFGMGFLTEILLLDNAFQYSRARPQTGHFRGSSCSSARTALPLRRYSRYA